MTAPLPFSVLTRRHVLAGLASLLVLPRAARAQASLTAQQAHAQALAGEAVLIDIRRPEEWQMTGIPEGAQPLGMRREDFGGRLYELLGGDPSRPVAVICATGGRSGYVAAELAKAGFTDVRDVSEGMQGSAAGPGWLRRGLPVTQWAGE